MAFTHGVPAPKLPPTPAPLWTRQPTAKHPPTQSWVVQPAKFPVSKSPLTTRLAATPFNDAKDMANSDRSKSFRIVFSGPTPYFKLSLKQAAIFDIPAPVESLHAAVFPISCAPPE